MSQYRLGVVTTENGSETVTGAGTEWLENVKAGDLFSIQRENVWYEVESVTSDTVLTLKSAYVGADQTDAGYAVHRDFTPAQRYPTPAYGDIDTASLIAATLVRIDAQFGMFGLTNDGLTGTGADVLTLRRGATDAPPANLVSGVKVTRGTQPDVGLMWDEARGAWVLTGNLIVRVGATEYNIADIL